MAGERVSGACVVPVAAWLLLLTTSCMTVPGDQDVQQGPVAEERGAIPKGSLQESSVLLTGVNTTIDYSVYLPPNFDESASYPAVYLLHGRGDGNQAWHRTRALFDELIADEAVPPFIAIMPDVPFAERASYYVNSDYLEIAVESALVEEFLPHIESTLPVHTGREARLVAGYSMGGYGATRYLFAHPDVFSAAIVLSPAVYTPVPPEDSSARSYGAFGSGDSSFDADRYRELNYPTLLRQFRGGRTPAKVFIAVGDDEWKHPHPEDAMHDLDMEAHLLFNRLSRINGVEAEFRVYDGGHDWDVWLRGLREGLIHLSRHLRLGGFSQSSEN